MDDAANAAVDASMLAEVLRPSQPQSERRDKNEKVVFNVMIVNAAELCEMKAYAASA